MTIPYRSLLRAVALACFALPACSRTTDPGLSGTARNLTELEERLGILRGRLGIPGLAVGIAEGDHIVWAKGLGFADLEQQKPPTSTTDFHLASLTKGFAGVVVVKLVAQGLISLDDPVSKYGVNISGDAGITVRHLANMTSEGTPGRTFTYNGDRFDLLKQVIESATKKSFAEVLMQQIVTPLALTGTAPNVASSSFVASGLDRDAFIANLAVGYTAKGSSFERTTYPSNFGAAAGLISTVDDMLSFSIAIDSDRLLTANERSMLFEPAKSTSGATLPYAIGWFSQNIRGVEIQWAYGYWTAISSLIIRVPSLRRTFVTLANSDGLSADFPLGKGDLESSPVAREFLEAFVFGNADLR
jgi:CubicO group peptidase (beta-lactamase class C family)